MTKPLFSLGRVVGTPGAIDELDHAAISAMSVLALHQTGYWGDMDEEDKAANNAAVKNGNRIMSAYTLTTGVTIWVITEADRASTTILLPREY